MRWPELKRDHPNYFLVVVALTIFHLLGAINETFLAHDALYWQYVAALVGGNMAWWGLIHLLAVVFMARGLYRPERFILARVGFALSLVISNAFTVGTVWGIFQHNFGHPNFPYTFAYPIATAVVSLCSWAAFREPQTRTVCTEAHAKAQVLRGRA